MSATPPVRADRGDLGAFIDLLFRYADTGTFASLRAFHHDPARRPACIRAVEINGDLSRIVDEAEAMATDVANHAEPVVFAPPIATFVDRKSATEVALANGLALSVECDSTPAEARRRLTGILGRPTLVIASGGEWTDPATGELEQKLHLHWRLTEPTREAAEHGRLKSARRLAAVLAGGDTTNVPVVHCLRWPGSWHRKGQPRLARVVEANPEAEIDLRDAEERLAGACRVAGIRLPSDAAGAGGAGGEPWPLEDTVAALRSVENTLCRLDWVKLASALKTSYGEAAWPAFSDFSLRYSKSDCTEAEATKVWRSSTVGRATFGSVVTLLRDCGSQERPEPAPRQDAPAQSTEPPWPEPLAPEAFHGLAGEIVRAIEPHTEADMAALLFQFVIGFGNTVGRGAFLRVDGAKHYTNENVVIVAATAKGRKGTSFGRVRESLEWADADWSEGRIVSGLSSGEGLIWQVRDEIIKRQKNDKTGEVDEVTTDPGVDDKRLLVYESEFASTLRQVERAGNTLSPILRDAWDRGTLQALTKNSPARATGAHISIVGHITADELRRYLNRTEAGNGFANRFLFVCAQRSKLLPFGGQSVDWGKLPTRLEQAMASARPIGQVNWTTAARGVWTSVYRDLSEGKPGLLGAVTARAEPHVLRLALIYALLDGSAFLDAPHLMAGLALWTYAEQSAAHIFGSSLGDPTADEILRALRQAPAGMTRTELSALFSRNIDANEIGRALAALHSQNLVRRETVPTGGRSAERWRAA